MKTPDNESVRLLKELFRDGYLDEVPDDLWNRVEAAILGGK
jgi:hypothetical protein